MPTSTPFLRQRFPGVRYCGIELLPELLDWTQARYGSDRHVTLSQGAFLRASLPQADYVLASGSPNYRPAVPVSSTRSSKAYRLDLGFNLPSGSLPPTGVLESVMNLKHV